MTYLERQTESLRDELKENLITDAEFWEYLKDLQDECSDVYETEYLASNEK